MSDIQQKNIEISTVNPSVPISTLSMNGLSNTIKKQMLPGWNNKWDLFLCHPQRTCLDLNIQIGYKKKDA